MDDDEASSWLAGSNGQQQQHSMAAAKKKTKKKQQHKQEWSAAAAPRGSQGSEGNKNELQANCGGGEWQWSVSGIGREKATAATAPAPGSANNGLVKPASESSSSNNNNNNNSNNTGHSQASSGRKSSSYSKLFRQYLPHSLNLNPANKSNNSRASSKSNASIGINSIGSSSSGDSSFSKASARRGNKPEGALLSEGNHQREESPGRELLLSSNNNSGGQSKSIVSALSRFRLSTSSSGSSNGGSGKPQSSSNSLSGTKESSKQFLHNHQRPPADNLDSRQLIKSRGSREFASSSPPLVVVGGCDPTADSSRPTAAAAAGKPSSNSNDTEQRSKSSTLNGQSAVNAAAKIRRKGFLYLKKSAGFTTKSVGGDQLIEHPALDVQFHEQAQQQRHILNTTTTTATIPGRVLGSNSSSSGKRRADLNNNSIGSFLASSCSQHHDQEHTACLLEEDEEDEEEESHVAIGGEEEWRKERHQQHQMEGFEHLRTTRAVAGARNKQQGTINNNNAKMTPRSYGGPTKPSGPKALVFAGCLMLTMALLALLSPASRLVVLAQQQQQQAPFNSARTQPGSSDRQAGAQGGSTGSSRPAPQPAAGSLVANINCNKIRGHVTLTPNLQGGTTVSTQISAGPPGEVYQWSVHQFPVKPGAAMCSCSALILGTKLIDLSEMHGNLPSDQEFSVQSSLSLFGADSPVGHSLMLRGMKTGMVACATFLPTSRKSNYRAKFHTPLSGSVTIFQTAFGTSFISHLMYSNGTRRHSMHRFDLVRSEDDLQATSLPLSGAATPAGGRPESLASLEQREHEHELSQCRRFTTGEPLFKNISYQLAVSTENFGMRGRTSLVLPQIPFETFSSVYLVVYSEHDPGEPIACAPLRFVKPKTAAAKFQTVSVQGSVVFSQDSPYDVTVARVNLQLPNSDGHSYGIDELPMIIRRKSDTRVCPNIREIIYNPHHVEPSSVPPEGEATSDQYAVGDLSGKYGSLTGKSAEKIQVNDYNLPLFGPISIVGRAMTVYSAEGVAIACSNVELTTPMTTAFATFDFGIQGQFIFRQPLNDCNGDTYVYIEVSKPTGSSAGSGTSSSSSSSSLLGATSANGAGGLDPFRSLDHNWHIHVNPVDSGLDHLSTTDCLPAGPHFNPYNTSTSSIYSRDCTPFNVLRCELGDLSAKMFTIEIPPYRVKGGQEPDIGKFFGTDIDLPLCGPVSIVNRSVVVHVQDFGAQRLACSTVIEFKPRTTAAAAAAS